MRFCVMPMLALAGCSATTSGGANDLGADLALVSARGCPVPSDATPITAETYFLSDECAPRTLDDTPITSAAELADHVSVGSDAGAECALPAIDFASRRLVLVRADNPTTPGVSETDEQVYVVMTVFPSGAPPSRRIAAVVLPASNKPVSSCVYYVPCNPDCPP